MCTHEFKVEHHDVSFVYMPLLFVRILLCLVPSSVSFLSTDIAVVACVHFILDTSLAQYPFQSTSQQAVRPFYFSHFMCTLEFKVEHRDVSFVYIPLQFVRIMHCVVPSSVPFLSTGVWLLCLCHWAISHCFLHLYT
jgi:hypothetical protein